MGKQIEFYMMEADEARFAEFVRSTDDVCVFMDRMREAQIEPISTLPDRSVPGWFNLYLWNETISPPPKLRFVSEQEHYVVDFLWSEVIEFSRSSMEDNSLVRGRIWAVFNGWDLDDPSSVNVKSDAFAKWYKRLEGWVRRQGTRNSVGEYVFPEAARFADGGGQLRQFLTETEVKLFHH